MSLCTIATLIPRWCTDTLGATTAEAQRGQGVRRKAEAPEKNGERGKLGQERLEVGWEVVMFLFNIVNLNVWLFLFDYLARCFVEVVVIMFGFNEGRFCWGCFACYVFLCSCSMFLPSLWCFMSCMFCFFFVANFSGAFCLNVVRICWGCCDLTIWIWGKCCFKVVYDFLVFYSFHFFISFLLLFYLFWVRFVQVFFLCRWVLSCLNILFLEISILQMGHSTFSFCFSSFCPLHCS